MVDDRFIIIEHKDKDYILDLEECNSYDPDTDLIELLGDSLSSDELVTRLNSMDKEITKVKQYNDNLNLLCSSLVEDKYLLQGMINCKYKEAKKMINQQYNLPIGTSLEYWFGVHDTCYKLRELMKNIIRKEEVG